MARTRQRIENPMLPLRRAASLFKQQTLNQLEANFRTQQIWPYEVYPGYRTVNEARRARGDAWVSTGEGIRSFRGAVLGDDRMGNLEMHFWFNDYLRYVDLGVGQGTDADDVQRGSKARFDRRYVRSWNRRQEGRSHRPAIMMEMRHLQTRLQGYALDFYGYEGQFRVLEGVPEEIEIPVP